MIVSFSVSNFRSFSAEETFSLVASRRLSGMHDDHLMEIPGSAERVLPIAVIYGANGAGKSNLFKALRFLKTMVLEQRDRKRSTGRVRFRFNNDRNDPSSFDLQFIANRRLYRYGVKVTDDRVSEEWLIEVMGAREKVLFERVTNESGKVTIDVAGQREPNDKVQALATVGGPQNQTFLATLNVTLDASDLPEEYRGVLEWFRSDLVLIAPDQSVKSLGHHLSEDPELLNFAGQFLKAASTGVDRLEIDKKDVAEEEIDNMLPKELSLQVFKDLPENEDGLAHLHLGDGNEFLLERKGRKLYRITIQAAHDLAAGGSVQLRLSDESDGTRRLLDLTPALYHLAQSEGVYFIDEVDRSLHPSLVFKFLQSFLWRCKAGMRQIIVTTHESNLLDLELLRRDEIWFAEKDGALATRLYSLADFKVRKDHEVRKRYLQGRYGAVPFLGRIDNLTEDQTHCQ